MTTARQSAVSAPATASVPARIQAGEQALPVTMTSFAIILGLLPLVMASGASELARRHDGTPVFGGMIFASFVGILPFRHSMSLSRPIRDRLRPGARPKLERAPAE